MTTKHIHPKRKGPRAMGASRDFTTGTPTGATGVLERDRSSRPSRATAPAEASARATAPVRRNRTDVAPGTERTGAPERGNRRLGSRQVVSVRGCRVAPAKKASSLARVSVVAIIMLISGVALAMWLSGLATQQTFRIQQLSSQESQLSNQLETLHRDLENVSSSAEVARRASDMGMVVPQQPGILEASQPGQSRNSARRAPGPAPSSTSTAPRSARVRPPATRTAPMNSSIAWPRCRTTRPRHPPRRPRRPRTPTSRRLPRTATTPTAPVGHRHRHRLRPTTTSTTLNSPRNRRVRAGCDTTQHLGTALWTVRARRQLRVRPCVVTPPNQ